MFTRGGPQWQKMAICIHSRFKAQRFFVFFSFCFCFEKKEKELLVPRNVDLTMTAGGHGFVWQGSTFVHGVPEKTGNVNVSWAFLRWHWVRAYNPPAASAHEMDLRGVRIVVF